MSQKAFELFEHSFKEKADKVAGISSHGSARRIYRLSNSSRSVIAVENDDVKENRAFITFSRHFKKFSLPVPEIYAEDSNGLVYLQEDLGDETLFDRLSQERGSKDIFPRKVEELYEKALSLLPKFQVEAGATLDYDVCHKYTSFGPEMMLRDMEYFREQYLDRTGWKYDAPSLESEFKSLAKFLSEARNDFFMYRDFQSRNIMLKGDKLFFIDYQGGCKGSLQYDVASLLYQAAARVPEAARQRLLGVYLASLAKYCKIDRPSFLRHFNAFVYLRIMQVLGTYGLRGLEEKKQYFIESIGHALGNLRRLYEREGLPVRMPEFEKFIRSIDMTNQSPVRLSVLICSISYKQDLAVPAGVHSGGFVFDCRCLPNPGREEQYKYLSGLDEPVKKFLAGKPEVDKFLNSTIHIVEQSVEAYIARNFSSLTVAFGCTGGQHRSVYLAEKLAAHLKSKFDIDVEVKHLSRQHWLKSGVA